MNISSGYETRDGMSHANTVTVPYSMVEKDAVILKPGRKRE